MMASVSLAYYGNMNYYQANTERPAYGIPGHLPVHFSNQYLVSHDYKDYTSTRDHYLIYPSYYTNTNSHYLPHSLY
jgi:hypothetical protein